MYTQQSQEQGAKKSETNTCNRNVIHYYIFLTKAQFTCSMFLYPQYHLGEESCLQ